MKSARLAFYLLVIASLTVSAHAAGTIPFLTATNYSVGLSPRTVAAGDFNHDGKMDLVVTPADQKYVDILIGNGDGTFQAALTYKTANLHPYEVAVGDFDGDDNVDLAVAVDIGLTILLGNGDGTFRSGTLFANSIGNYLTAVDVNNDGKLDLVYLGAVQLGNGDGTFQPPLVVNAFGEYWQTVGDFNHDGKIDLAIGLNQEPGEVDILLGKGNGTFGSPTPYTLPDGGGPIATGDFNGDGKLDLAISGPTQGVYSLPGSVTLMLGNGNGTFQTPQLLSKVTGVEAGAILAGDFSGDNKADLAVINQASNNISELLGKGDGSFQRTTSWAIGATPYAMTTTDLNGDGLLDIAVVELNSSKITALLSRQGGGFNAPREFGAGSEPKFGNTGDFNEDGILDLVTGNAGGVTVVPGRGNGTFDQPLSHSVGGVGTEQNVVVDLNHDGHLDIIALQQNITANGKIAVLLGNGDGTLQNPVTYAVGVDSTAITAGDFNGDGNPDIAVANDGYFNYGNISLFIGNGDGTLQPAITLSLGNEYVGWCYAGDFNGDGKLDLAVVAGVSGAGATNVLLGNGDGTFGAPTTPLNLSGVAAAVADFNHDGRLDLAVIDYSHLVTIALGNGDGTFSAGATYQVGSGPTAIVAADFDGDGILDLAVSSDESKDQSKLSILKGDGDGTFQQPSTIHIGSVAYSLAPGDFNRDGKIDLAVINLGSSKATILLNSGP